MFEEVEEFKTGFAENPMTRDEIAAKFGESASGVLDSARRQRLAAEILALDQLSDARTVID